ncbi:hypothetical protein [Paenibacillus jilunlii]|nr:hypothetical protein [Paenibacillus jilunlii]
MDTFYSLCLQGDIPQAMDHLKSIQPRTGEITAIEQRFTERFYSKDNEEQIASPDSWIKSVILTYHAYFRTVLTRSEKVPVAAAEEHLKNALAPLVQMENTPDLDAIEQKLTLIFAEKGYYFLGGVTPPYRGPYIWRTMESMDYKVELPSGLQHVTVYMLSDFLLEGWISFATCEHKWVGGWADVEGLYCNFKRYGDLQSEEFQISYLKHEAQHQYDYSQFPDMKSTELEYRAKLVELFYSKDHAVLNKFLLQAKNDPDFPHPYASYLIIRNLSALIFNKDYEPETRLWLGIDYKDISASALRLFESRLPL